MFSVKPEGQVRELIERSLPLRLKHARKMPLRIAGVGTRQRIERRSNHELEIALGQHFVGVFEVEHLALLGDAQLAVEGIHGLGEDGAMRGTAPTAHSPAATMEEAQL